MSDIDWLKIIDNIIEEIDDNFDTLSKLNMNDSGKSKMFADKENERCKKILLSQKTNIKQFYEAKNKRFIPLGTVLILTPFSSAYTSILHKLIPSLLVGNKCIIKSSNFTNNCSAYFIDMLKSCMPAKLANKIIFKEDLNSVKEIIKKQAFDVILFTGKSETAKEIKKQIGRKRGVFETGSLALAYIDKDIDLDKVAHEICDNSFAQNGMRCIGLKNVFIHASIYDALKEKIVKLVNTYKRNENYIREFKNQQTKKEILQNIENYLSNGYTNLQSDLTFPILIESSLNIKNYFLKEMYGPVLCLHRVDDINKIPLEYLKRSSLSTSIYSNNQNNIKLFIKNDIYTGSILINKGPAIRNDDLPFGGFYDENENKESFWDIINIASNIQIIDKL